MKWKNSEHPGTGFLETPEERTSVKKKKSKSVVTTGSEVAPESGTNVTAMLTMKRTILIRDMTTAAAVYRWDRKFMTHRKYPP